MRSRRLLLVLIVLLTFSALPTRAEIPALISFQGRLTDTAGTLLSGAYNVTIRLYDASSGGNLLWQESQNGVAVVNGIHNMYLGSVTPLTTLDFRNAYWISIELNGGGEMTPRRQVTTSPYAFRARYADTVTNARGLDTEFVNVSGDTMTGSLVVRGRVKADSVAVDELSAGTGETVAVANSILINGGIHIRGNANVDTLFAFGDTLTVIDNVRINGGIHIHGSVKAETYVGSGAGLTNLNISSIDTSGLATAGHHHDSVYVNVTGDSMTGNLEITGNLIVSGTVDGVDVSAHAADTGLHHARYTDTEAVTAMGVKLDTNPLHHNRYTDTEARAAVTAQALSGTVTATAFVGSGAGLTGVVADTTRITLSGDSIVGGTIGNTVRIQTSGRIQTSDTLYADTITSPNTDTLFVNDNLRVGGTISALRFLGDGSGLTGVVAGTDTDWIYSAGDSVYRMTGNVGIGTSSPSARLTIVGTTNDSSAIALHVRAADGTGRAFVRNSGEAYFGGGDFVIGGSAINQGSLIVHNYNYGLSKYAGGYLYLHSSDAIGFGRLDGNRSSYADRDANFIRQMVLMQDGRLNIGPGAGRASDSLSVEGAVRFDSGLSVDTSVLYVDATTNRVGVGTTAPTDSLTVTGDVVARRLYDVNGLGLSAHRLHNRNRADGSIGVHLRDDTTAGQGDISLQYYYPIRFTQVLPAREVLTIGSGAGNGEIGIGDTSPAASLEIARNGLVPLMRLSSTDQAANSGDLFSVTSSGYVGIGTSNPSDSLTVAGSLSVDSITLVVNSATDRVGVGTSSPLTPLDVRGALSSNQSSAAWGNQATLYLAAPTNTAGSLRFHQGSFDPASNATRFWSLVNDFDQNGTNDFRIVASNPALGGETMALTVRQTGYVGIGTTTPSRMLTVAGRAHVQDTLTVNRAVGINIDPRYPIHDSSGAYLSVGGVWTNASSRSFKTDIEEYSADEYRASAELLDSVTVVRYRYRSEGADGDIHIGLIAEDAPDVLVSPDRRGVPTGDAIGYLLAVVKALRQQNAELQLRIERLEQMNQQ